MSDDDLDEPETLPALPNNAPGAAVFNRALFERPELWSLDDLGDASAMLGALESVIKKRRKQLSELLETTLLSDDSPGELTASGKSYGYASPMGKVSVSHGEKVTVDPQAIRALFNARGLPDPLQDLMVPAKRKIIADAVDELIADEDLYPFDFWEVTEWKIDHDALEALVDSGELTREDLDACMQTIQGRRSVRVTLKKEHKQALEDHLATARELEEGS